MRLWGTKADEETRSGGVILKEPTYYEVWASLENANRALWAALWIVGTSLILAGGVIRLLLSRPPVVITVNPTGEASVVQMGRAAPVSEIEVKNFVSLFERFYTELDAFTYGSDLKSAFAMMTKEYQAKADERIKKDRVVEALKANQTKTALTITEIRIAKDTPQYLDCRVKGYRDIGSHKSDETTNEVVFEDDVLLKKVTRSMSAPYGVLVQDWSESLFKK